MPKELVAFCIFRVYYVLYWAKPIVMISYSGIIACRALEAAAGDLPGRVQRKYNNI